MLKTHTLSLSLALALSAVAAQANEPAKTAAKPAAAKAAKPAAKAPAKSSTTAKTAGVAAAGGAAAVAATAALSQGQLDAATRVYTGTASCEFGEQIAVNAVDGKPGHFQLKHKTSTYNLVPEETTTGAVRLEDKRAGIVWLQIPSKSMLMNAKIGQRVADNCQMAQQKS